MSVVGSQPKLQRLFELLLKKGRINILSDLSREATKVKASLKNEVVADIETSIGFDASSTALFQNYLQKQTNKKIALNVRETSTILGGFKARVGHTVYDFTLENAFQKLKKTFNS